MASAAKKGGGGGGDVVLESRHLVGLFLMMVVIFGVVFVLGYELGRNQVSGQVRASDATEENAAALGGSAIVPPSASGPVSQPAAPSATVNHPASAPPKTPAPTAKNSNSKNNSVQPPAINNSTKAGAKSPVAPPAKNAAPKSQPVAPAKNKVAPPSSALRSTPSAANAPLIPKGSVVLQVSALTVESDALKMAQELQQKKFPAFVLAPGADHFYRVQVGPYADPKAADKARAALEKEGFKPIVKH
jgi:cell division septation protein DedD